MEGKGRIDSLPEDGKLLAAQIAISALATAVIAVLFYKSVWGAALAPVVFVICHAFTGKVVKEKRDRKFIEEFRQFLELLTSSLQAGYSIENSVLEATKDMRSLYGDKAEMAAILSTFSARMKLQIPLEVLFNEMAEQKPYEEVVEFAGMFAFAKKMGGDYVRHIDQTASKISEKIRVRQEIDSVIAAKRMELYIMCIMPIAILAFVNVSSSDFLNGLYHNAAGALIMSICLILYAGCVYLGMRITDIEV